MTALESLHNATSNLSRARSDVKNVPWVLPCARWAPIETQYHALRLQSVRRPQLHRVPLQSLWRWSVKYHLQSKILRQPSVSHRAGLLFRMRLLHPLFLLAVLGNLMAADAAANGAKHGVVSGIMTCHGARGGA